MATIDKPRLCCIVTIANLNVLCNHQGDVQNYIKFNNKKEKVSSERLSNEFIYGKIGLFSGNFLQNHGELVCHICHWY